MQPPSRPMERGGEGTHSGEKSKHTVEKSQHRREEKEHTEEKSQNREGTCGQTNTDLTVRYLDSSPDNLDFEGAC